MTPLLLQDSIIDELKILLAGTLLKNKAGALVPINFYTQFLPPKTGINDLRLFPHIRPIFIESTDPNEEDAATCRIQLMFAIFDDDSNYQGYRDIMNLMQKVESHLRRIRVINNRFELLYPVTSYLHDENTHPQFYGAIDTIWTIGKTTLADDPLI